MKGGVILIYLVNKQDFTFPNVGCECVAACGCYFKPCPCNGTYCGPQLCSPKATPWSDTQKFNT